MRSVLADFPLLKTRIRGKRIVYLDSTATSLKPQAVLDGMNRYNREYSANVFRGLYDISERATAEFEKAREKIAKFIGATTSREVIFVRNASEALNLVASTWGKENIKKNDVIITTIMEHHSNFVPWQQLAEEKEATLKVVGLQSGYKLDEVELLSAVKGAKLLALTHISNVLGTINPIQEFIKKIRKINPDIVIVVDGAQSVPHIPVNVALLDCDFFAFSGHKMLGPTGIGVLWGKAKLLEQMRPYMYGGEMIERVTLEKSTFQEIPLKFEAGTPDIAGAIGLGYAVDCLRSIGMDNVRKYEENLTELALDKLSKLKNITMYGPGNASEKCGVVAFNVFGKSKKLIHPHDVAQILNEDNICVRSGHHCAMLLHNALKLAATTRASFYIYNTEEDIDALVLGLKKAIKILG